jgi:hypothetical protein
MHSAPWTDTKQKAPAWNSLDSLLFGPPDQVVDRLVQLTAELP